MTPLDQNANRIEKHFSALIFVFFLSILLGRGSLFGQSRISGRILTRNEKPLHHANVLLLQSADSSLVKGTVSDENGNYYLENISSGIYLISASFAGMKNGFSEKLTVEHGSNVDAGSLVLLESVMEMAAVRVTARKQLFEQKPDRVIVNVQNSITAAGNTALEVLERSPGVVVNRQDLSIALAGKEGVTMMINGKATYMPADALLELLNGMNASNIEKIELITSPSASMDAEGKGGVINIITRRNNAYGVSGSFAATLGYGHGPITEASLNFNLRKRRINFFGNYSFSRIRKPLPIDSYTKVINQSGTRETQFIAGRTEDVTNMNGRLGFDYQLTDKTVLGVLFSGYDNSYHQSEENVNRILKNGILDTMELQANHEHNHWQNISGNLNLQHEFREGSKLSANLDYIYYENNQPYFYHSYYYEPSGDFMYDEMKRSAKHTPIGIWIEALDYSKKLGKKLLWESGLKRTIADFSNDQRVERSRQGVWLPDSSAVDRQMLKEDYTAVYTSIGWSLNEKNHAKFGLRYEYTNSSLSSAVKGRIVDRHYGNFFPALNFNHKINDLNAINFSFNVRITRPTFNQLAPYVYYINESTIITGNPGLQPTISNSIGVNYSYKKYIFSLSASLENHPIWIFQPRADTLAGKLIMTPENLEHQKLVSLMASIPIEITKWWSMQGNITGVWQEVDAVGNSSLKLSRFNVNLNVSESFRLGKGLAMEISGFYQSPLYAGINLQKAYGSLDFGLRQKLPGKSGTLSLSANNLLLSQDYIVTADYPERNLSNYLRVNFNQRSFKLTYTRNFGNDKLKERRERSTGAEEEKGRVQ